MSNLKVIILAAGMGSRLRPLTNDKPKCMIKLLDETLRNVLHIPDHVVPIAYLCLGHVNKFESKPDLEKSGWLPRLKLDDVIYHEEWLQDEPKIVR